MNNNLKIILTGGGTLGSVTPLLAVYENLLQQGASTENFLWVGTSDGPEKEFIKNYKIKYETINSGKLRRYFSLENFFDLIKIIIGFFESLNIIYRFKPDLIISAGGFVSVPLVWAGRFFGKKIIIHQQDLRPGLANKIMALAADKITVTFEKSLKDFNESKTVWTGNPVRKEFTKTKPARIATQSFAGGDLRSKTDDLNKFNLIDGKPILLVLGGGTGALSINKLIIESLTEILKYCQIIHLTGKGKSLLENEKLLNGYHSYEFLNEELFVALALADVVISRAGMSALTELSYLGKPTIVIPIPDSHQEDNAKYFADKEAVIYLKQKDLTKDKLIEIIKDFLENKEKRERFGNNFKKAMKQGANLNMIEVVNSLL